MVNLLYQFVDWIFDLVDFILNIEFPLFTWTGMDYTITYGNMILIFYILMQAVYWIKHPKKENEK